MTIRLYLIGAGLTSLLLCGCGKDKTTKTGAGSSPSSETTSTLSGADKNLEFYSERYLPSQQRLEKRQERLRSIVSPSQ